MRMTDSPSRLDSTPHFVPVTKGGIILKWEECGNVFLIRYFCMSQEPYVAGCIYGCVLSSSYVRPLDIRHKVVVVA